MTMGPDKEAADDLVAQMNEAQRILDIHGEDELVKRTGKYPGDYLKAGASEIAALRSRVAQLEDGLHAVGWECDPDDCEWSDKAFARRYLWAITSKLIGTPDGERAEHAWKALAPLPQYSSTPTGSDNAAPLKTEGGT